MSSPKRAQQHNQSHGPSEHEYQLMANELDHHKNLLIGLNEKLTVFNDIKEDLEKHRSMISQSENARNDLQDSMKATSVQVSEHAADHKQYQETLILENNNLKKLVQAMESKAA